MTSITITPIHIGTLRADLSQWYRLPDDHPYARQVDDIAIFCYHIAFPGRSVLVDAAVYEFPPELAGMKIPGHTPLSLIEQLTAKGIGVEAITDVIITHAHFDHINGLTQRLDGQYKPSFPHARHYLGIGDWQPEQFGALERNTLGVLQQYGRLTLVEGLHELEDGLVIVPAPGETPGHQILHVQTGKVDAYFTGDLYHHPLELSEADLMVYWAEQEMMRKSKDALIEQAANAGSQVYFAHFEGPYLVERTDQVVNWRKMSRVDE